jgi:hypothetical protein
MVGFGVKYRVSGEGGSETSLSTGRQSSMQRAAREARFAALIT